MATIVQSDDIYVFPATKRGEVYNQKARLFREESVTNMVSNPFEKIGDNDGFIIGEKTEDEKEYIEFCIKGYYIKVLKSDVMALVTDTTPDIYAGIALGVSGDYVELLGQDTEDTSVSPSVYKYPGVVFSTTTPTKGDMVEATKIATKYTISEDDIGSVYSILLISDKVINPDAYYRLDRHGVNITAIDGGTI